MSTDHVCERAYEFSLLLSGISQLTGEVEDALFSAHCDDATLSFQYGGARLEFTRVAASMKDAILSAIRDIGRSGLPVSVLQVDECSLVTQAEIARRIERTRSLIGLFISGGRGPGGFPPPVCHLGENTSLWRWCEVSFWLSSHDMIHPDMLIEAEVVAAINNTLDRIHQECRNRPLMEEVSAALKASMSSHCR